MMVNNIQRWLVFVACGLMILLINIDLTIVNLALPSIARTLSASLNQVQWVIASYLLATAAFLTLFGKLADVIGKKRVFLFGIVLFTLASLLAGLTNQLPILILARVVQGIGFAATLGLAIVIIVQAFPHEKKGYITGLAVTISGLAQAAGPLIGGLILAHASWHWVFLINIPVGLIAFTLGWASIASDSRFDQASKFSPFNGIAFILLISLVVYILNQATLLVQTPMLFVGLILLAAVLVAVFVYSSLKKSGPLIDISLLTHRGYINVLLIRLIFMTAMASMLFLLPLYLENIIGLSPWLIGRLLLFMTVMVALCAPLTGKLIDRTGFKPLLLVSLVSMLLVLISMFGFGTQFAWLPVSFGLVFLGMAIGVHTPASINGALASVSKQHAGTAIGLFYTIATTGAVLGVALAGGVLGYFSQHYLVVHWGKMSGQITQHAFSVAKGIQAATALNAWPHIKLITQQAFVYAFHRFLWIEIVLFLVGILLCLSLKTKKTS